MIGQKIGRHQEKNGGRHQEKNGGRHQETNGRSKWRSTPGEKRQLQCLPNLTAERTDGRTNERTDGRTDGISAEFPPKFPPPFLKHFFRFLARALAPRQKSEKMPSFTAEPATHSAEIPPNSAKIRNVVDMF